MRSAIVSMALALAMTTTASTPASAQLFRPRSNAPEANQAPAQSPAPAPATVSEEGTEDTMVFQSGDVLPAPLHPEELGEPMIALPAEPIDAYLLTKQAGPFMVMAHVFRGDHAAKKAQALAMELRGDFQLPAYVFYLKIKPGGSNIQGIPPTAPRQDHDPLLPASEVYRSIDEAAVLVGHCATIAEAKHLWTKIKKIQPRTLHGTKSSFFWRDGKGLKSALVTTNPLLPAQDLYPGRPGPGGHHHHHHHPHHHQGGPVVHNGAVVDPEVLRSQFVKPIDPLVLKMNEDGPYSIFKCPAPYTLVVAEFGGLTSLNPNDPRFRTPGIFKKSPLQTAAEEAEKLANDLAKHPEIRALGVQPYIYHDRTSSRVTLGAYHSPNDPNANRVRQVVLKVFIEEQNRKDSSKRPFLAPASDLLPVPRPAAN